MKYSRILLSVLCELIISLVDGNVITIDKAPFMVWVGNRLQHERNFGSGKICAGSILSERAILTAAHCYTVKYTVAGQDFDTSPFIVVAGGANGQKAEKETQVYPIERIVLHENYNALTFENDIAMVFIHGYMDLNSNARKPVPLANQQPIVGDKCLVYGWGLTNKTQLPIVLQESPITIWNFKGCAHKYPGMPGSGICAGSEAKLSDSSCHIGLGGALICLNKLYGIVHYAECIRAAIPDVYTNAFYHRQWIRSVNTTFEHCKGSLQSNKSPRNFNLQFISCIVVKFILLWS